MIDTRGKNEYPKANSPVEYLVEYTKRLSEVVNQIPGEALDAVYAILKSARLSNSRIYVAGNGGSSAIGSHLCCDWMKGTYMENQPTLKVQSLTADTAVLTAFANDYSYEECVSEQVRMVGDPGDVLLVISSSGNSPNVVAAARMARQKRMRVIAFTGFAGGVLKEISDVCVHVPVSNYGMAEDAHQMLMHVFAQFLYLELAKKGSREEAASTSPKEPSLSV